MKNYLIIFSILLLFTVFLIIQKSYTILPSESAITTSIQQQLEDDIKISSIKEYAISKSNTKIVFFKQDNKIGYAIFKRNIFNEKLKSIFVKDNILHKNINILYTNRGNYVLFSGNYNEKIDSIVVKEGNTKHLLKVSLINESIGNLYITLETIPRNITEEMLDNSILYNKDNQPVR